MIWRHELKDVEDTSSVERAEKVGSFKTQGKCAGGGPFGFDGASPPDR